MLLAIDTSTEMASLALSERGQLIIETTWYCGQNHTLQLLPQLNDMLEKIETAITEVTAIIVAIGPGSFNGLRVGISTAKGLAFSLGVPIVGISTLEVSAYQHMECGLPICAIHNAGRSEIATATYCMLRKHWQQVVPERITTLEQLVSGIHTRTLFCGEYIPSIIENLKILGAKAVISSPASLPRRALFLAELGQIRLDMGIPDNITTLQPLYLRRPPITERKHH